MIDLNDNVSEKNRVIVRIWTSAWNKEYQGIGDVGHASIQIGNDYISLWPKGNPSGVFKQFFENREKYFITYEKDLWLEENNKPSFIVCLYLLDMSAIKQKAEELKDNVEHWTLFGNNCLLLKDDKTHSCSSIVYELLKEGGIYNFVASKFSAHYSSVVSPDNLISILKEAKKYEINKCPKIKNFKFEDETFLGESYENSSSFWTPKKIIGAAVVLGASYVAFNNCNIL